MRKFVALALVASVLAVVTAVAVAAPGDPDASFDGDGLATVDWFADDIGNAVAIAPDGKVVVAGRGFAAPQDIGISRFGANGALDLGFSEDGKLAFALGGVEVGNAVAVQPDGKVVAVGTTDVSQRAAIVRANADGTPDAGFGVMGVRTLEYGGDDGTQDVLLQPDGKIVVAGFGGTPRTMMVTRLSATDGLPDASFNGGGTAPIAFGGADTAFAVALQQDGKVLVTGVAGGAAGLGLARLNANGTPDTGFNGDGNADGKITLGAGSGALGTDVKVQPDGKILVLASAGGDFKVTRLNSDGSPDTGFGQNGIATVDFGGTDSATALALQANGKIVVAGQSVASRAEIARLQPGGALDSTFSGDGKQILPAGIATAGDVALQKDGKIVVAGGNGLTPGDVVVARIEGEPPDSGGGPSGGGPGDNNGSNRVPRCAGRRATIVGTNKANRLKGTRRADVIVGLGGNDKIAGGRGNDLICAGNGNDSAKGDSGKDRIFGQNGKDTLAGGTGNDVVDGGGSNDRVAGDSGKDKLVGGTGKDKILGGSGRDSCNGGSGRDTATCEKERAI